MACRGQPRTLLVAAIIAIAAGCTSSCSTSHGGLQGGAPAASSAPRSAPEANPSSTAAGASSASAAPVAQDAAEQATAALLDVILAGDQRSAADRARDVYRHPKETLLFFGIRPNMHVVEVWPEPGWYSEIIAPLVHGRGRYYAALEPGNTASTYVKRRRQGFRAMLAARADLYGGTEITSLAPDGGDIAPDGSADLVVTFRNIHNWMAEGWAPQAFAAMYRALKPGGVLGVVEHRGKQGLPQDPKAKSGYVDEDYAVQMIEAAGFKLIARSEINANPKDTKDYPQGVWSLPPTYRLGQVDRDKYAAIGESDRFTLKFVKPGT
jgi:predicted methyltransferase